MSDKKFDPITGEPIVNNQDIDNNKTIQLDTHPAINRGQSIQPTLWKQNMQQNLNNQYGQSMQQNLNNQYGQNMQQNLNNQYGQSMQQNLNDQYGQSMQQPINNPYGQQFQQNNLNSSYAFQNKKKKSKKITPQSLALGSAIVAVLVLTAFVFTDRSGASGMQDPSVAHQNSTPESEQESAKSNTVPPITPAKNNNPAPGNEYAMFSSFSINGKQYSLPLTIDELLENGWTYDNKEDANKTLYAGDYDSVQLNFSQKGESYERFGIINHSIDAQPLSKCLICELDFSDYFIKETGADIKFCNDKFVLQKTTLEEVKSELGEPNSTSTSGNSVTLTYRGKDGENEFNLTSTYNFDNNILTYVSMRNKTLPDDFEQPEVSTATPDYLTMYKAPSDLGDDPLSGNFSLDGQTYNLPVPYKTLAEQGWKCDGESESVPSMNGFVITLKKENYTLTAKAINPLPNAVTLENTIVVYISGFNSSVYPYDFTLSGDIKLGMSKDELDKVLNDKGITNFEYNEKFGTYRIPYDKNDKSEYPKETIEIYISEDKNIISSIDIERYGWLAED